MSKASTPKNDRLREMREANATKRPKLVATEKLVAVRAALSLTKSNKPAFDKAAYQREYMRKRRAEKAT